MVRSRSWVVWFVLAGCRPEGVAAPPAPVEGAEPAAEAPAEVSTEAPAVEARTAEAPATEAPAAPVSYTLEGNRLVLPGPVEFATGSDAITGDAALVHIRGYLEAKPYVTTMRIEAHVSGPDAQALSERRALTVARWLVGKGIDCKRLLPVGFGDTKPVADSGTPEGRAQNSRVEAHNAALRERPIGGMPTHGGGRVAGDPCT